MKTRLLSRVSSRASPINLTPPESVSQKDSQKGRLAVVGCDVRSGGALVATAVGPRTARRIADALTVMRGLVVPEGHAAAASGLARTIIESADELAAALMRDLAWKKVGSRRLRRLLQAYLERRGGLVGAKREAAYLEAKRKARERARRAQGRDDDPEAVEEGDDLDVVAEL